MTFRDNNRGRRDQRTVLSKGFVALSLGLAAAAPVMCYRPSEPGALRLLPSRDQTGQVALVAARARVQAGCVVVTGRVRNVSDRVCRRLEIVGETVDAHDATLTMGSALAANTCLKPGDRTSFRLILDHWPGGDRTRLTFRPFRVSIHTTRPLPVSGAASSQIGR